VGRCAAAISKPWGQKRLDVNLIIWWKRFRQCG